jgi:hypothetical protein
MLLLEVLTPGLNVFTLVLIFCFDCTPLLLNLWQLDILLIL